MAEDTDREQGVDFTEINPLLDGLDYPITAEELVEQDGDREVGRTNAEPISLESLLGPMGEETFESPEEVRQSILNMMPADSVGRQNYSDRGGAHPEVTEEARELDEEESL